VKYPVNESLINSEISCKWRSDKASWTFKWNVKYETLYLVKLSSCDPSQNKVVMSCKDEATKTYFSRKKRNSFQKIEKYLVPRSW